MLMNGNFVGVGRQIEAGRAGSAVATDIPAESDGSLLQAIKKAVDGGCSASSFRVALLL